MPRFRLASAPVETPPCRVVTMASSSYPSNAGQASTGSPPISRSSLAVRDDVGTDRVYVARRNNRRGGTTASRCPHGACSGRASSPSVAWFELFAAYSGSTPTAEGAEMDRAELVAFVQRRGVAVLAT